MADHHIIKPDSVRILAYKKARPDVANKVPKGKKAGKK